MTEQIHTPGSSRDDKLRKQLDEAALTGREVTADLFTDDKVLARITDGIYRQPASALRELIANAYDADATRVVIQTDAPRFHRISIHDNGIGMNKDTLVHLINHIGGSGKRNQTGAELGFANGSDPNLTPSGRRLIGKIGIGLFSVSQLTRRFTIITKRASDRHKLVADVSLFTYAEDDAVERVPNGRTKTGEVRIQVLPDDVVDAHYTEIILEPLQPAARDLLRSKDVWERVHSPHEDDLLEDFSPPRYHIGRLEPGSDETISHSANLPWTSKDSPEERLRKLSDAIVGEWESHSRKPSLDTLLDVYLKTLWTLSLSAPLQYIDGEHPFDLADESGLEFYRLSNAPRGQPELLVVDAGTPVRTSLGLTAQSNHDFVVFVDNVKLYRPIRFSELPQADLNNPKKRPLMFFGQYSPSLDKIPASARGGRALSFEAYFLWTPVVVPTDHIGVLVRINDASGTLFDETFFSYQVAELTRLQQITAEIFVLEGLDAALNIDRESFNFGHPHAKILSSWVHRVLRQVTNTQKKLTALAHEDARADAHNKSQQQLRQSLAKSLKVAQRDLSVVEFVDEAKVVEKRKAGVLALSHKRIFKELTKKPRGKRAVKERDLFEQEVAAVAQILSHYNLLDKLSYKRQEELLSAIVSVFKRYLK